MLQTKIFAKLRAVTIELGSKISSVDTDTLSINNYELRKKKEKL